MVVDFRSYCERLEYEVVEDIKERGVCSFRNGYVVKEGIQICYTQSSSLRSTSFPQALHTGFNRSSFKPGLSKDKG